MIAADVFCNCCGGTNWGNQGARPGVRCLSCGSLERTRLAKLFLDRWQLLQPSARILHFAPEQGLYQAIANCGCREYRAVDFDPSLFKFGQVERFDICLDAQHLLEGQYDIIINMHVMEHIPCNVTAALYYIHRALAPSGVHLLAVPILRGCYAEDLSPLDAKDAIDRFGQSDHVRKFGRENLDRTLGMIFELPSKYDMTSFFSASELGRANIPAAQWHGYTGSSILPVRKEHLLLKP